MLSLLLKLKDYFPVAVIALSLLYGTYEHVHNVSLNAKLVIANNQVSALGQQLASIKAVIAQQAKEQQKLEDDLRFREREAAARASESQKRANELLKVKVPTDCNEAIRWGLKHANVGN